MLNKNNKGAKTTREQVYQQLLDDILQFKLKPGISLSEKEISERLEVSRTPVREAFLHLEKEGLLEIYPQRGSVVTLIDYELIEEAQFMREQLELAVVKLACESFPVEELINIETNLKKQKFYVEEKDDRALFQLDEEFHYLLFKGCKKERVWDSIQQMNLHFKRVRFLRLKSDYHWDGIYEDHVDIYQAINDKNVKLAQDIMHRHLTRVWEDSSLLMNKFPEYFK